MTALLFAGGMMAVAVLIVGLGAIQGLRLVARLEFGATHPEARPSQRAAP